MVAAAGSSPAQYTLNLAATLVQNQDAGVQASAFPTTTDVAGNALLSSTVTNSGPVVGPITVVDQVPAGLDVLSSAAGLGTCTTSGQRVVCTINGLPVGQSTSVDVVVKPEAPGTYVNDVSVSPGPALTDPNSANNDAKTTLTVTALPQRCIVPGLRKMPLASARTLLKELGCNVHVTQKHSTIAKGLVISVRGGTRTWAYHQVVTVVVSSGPKRRRK